MKHLAGHYYHVFNRGVDKRNIFTSDENYRFLLRKFKANLSKYSITMIAYCLMPNHYHLLLRPDKDGVISSFTQAVFNGYVQAFNVQEKRSGTLFEGRAKVKCINKNEYFMHLLSYIHLNPVRAGLVAKPEDWPYSNYLEFIGLRKGTLFSPAIVSDNFESPHAYKTFVDGQISEEVQDFLRNLDLDE